jgi:VCBS repeat-containing protein
MSTSFNRVADALLTGPDEKGRGSILTPADRVGAALTTSTVAGAAPAAAAAAAAAGGAFQINLIVGAGLQANPAALAAFRRAAARWEAKLTDPVTVNITADLSDLGSTTTIGQTSSVTIEDTYDVVRNLMATDAADEVDDGLVAGALPATGNFVVPSRFTWSGKLSGTKANIKALGVAGLDAQFGASDGSITFNSRFAFDYDSGDGVGGTQMDFETVATHEIGHALGFQSMADSVDSWARFGLGISVPASTLDMFRFENDSAGRDPQTAAEFSSFPRSLRPNVDAVTDGIDAWGAAAAEGRMSTGYYTGDGRQASHWKDGDLTGTAVGIMDPTLAYGQSVGISDADWRAMDLIGWDVAPGPAAPNQPPVAVDDAATTRRDQVLSVAAPGVMGNDWDPEGNRLSVTPIVNGTTAQGGTVNLNEDGGYTYDPRGSAALRALGDGQSLNDTFTYTLNDGRGGTAGATVTINVTGVAGVRPAAPSDLAATSDGSTSRINLKWTDNSPDEQGFKVRRSTTATFDAGTFKDVQVGANTTAYTDAGLSAGKTYYYRVFAYATDDSDASNDASATTAAAFNNSAKPGNGLTGRYYNGTNFNTLKTTRTDGQVGTNYGTGAPAATGLTTNNFTIRWTGQVLPAYDEAYTFYVKADDNLRLWIDDPADPAPPQLVLRRWGTGNTSEYKTSPISMRAGHRYNIQVDYRELTGGASVYLSWASPSIAKQVIPKNQLYTQYLTDAGKPAATPAVYVDPNGTGEAPTIGIDNGNGSTAVTRTLASGGGNAGGPFSSKPVTDDSSRDGGKHRGAAEDVLGSSDDDVLVA